MDTNQVLLITAAAAGAAVWWQSRQSGPGPMPYPSTPSSELTSRQRQERARYVQQTRWGDPEWVDSYMDYAEQRGDMLTGTPEGGQFGVEFDVSTLPYDWAQEGWSP